MKNAIGALLAGGGLWFFLKGPSRRLRAGRRYRATFDVPPGQAQQIASIAAGVDTFFPDDLVEVKRGQIVMTFVAPKDAELEDVQTPFGVLKLRGLQELS